MRLKFITTYIYLSLIHTPPLSLSKNIYCDIYWKYQIFLRCAIFITRNLPFLIALSGYVCNFNLVHFSTVQTRSTVVQNGIIKVKQNLDQMCKYTPERACTLKDVIIRPQSNLRCYSNEFLCTRYKLKFLFKSIENSEI